MEEEKIGFAFHISELSILWEALTVLGSPPLVLDIVNKPGMKEHNLKEQTSINDFEGQPQENVEQNGEELVRQRLSCLEDEEKHLQTKLDELNSRIGCESRMRRARIRRQDISIGKCVKFA
jgi:hypothetical protein